MSKIKEHFKKHQTKYLVGGLFAGIILIEMRSNPTRPRLRGQAKQISPERTLETNGVTLLNSCAKNIYNHSTVNMGGYTRKLVQNSSTGETFNSVGEAADQAGISIQKMSRHINGHKDHINGDIYRIVGVGTN